MPKNTAGVELPEYFIPCRGTIMDYYRQVVNSRDWKNYLVTSYEDKYQGYDSIFKFRAELNKRIPLDYDAKLREHIVRKSNIKYVNHGRDGMVEKYFLQDHHTLLHIIVSKRVDTLTLMHRGVQPEEQIDEYLKIKRTYYYE
jgi:hypothetical protein